MIEIQMKKYLIISHAMFIIVNILKGVKPRDRKQEQKQLNGQNPTESKIRKIGQAKIKYVYCKV